MKNDEDNNNVNNIDDDNVIDYSTCHDFIDLIPSTKFFIQLCESTSILT